MKKTESVILKKDIFKGRVTGHYSFFASTEKFFNASILYSFLTDSYDGVFLRKWFFNEEMHGLETNQISLDKKENLIIFSDIFDQEEPRFEFSISHKTFLKMLDQWETAIKAKKKYIVIEVFDDNDVS